MKGAIINEENKKNIDGYGFYHYEGGLFYEGYWQAGKRHGLGYLKNAVA
jgi:hypothetical protein